VRVISCEYIWLSEVVSSVCLFLARITPHAT